MYLTKYPVKSCQIALPLTVTVTIANGTSIESVTSPRKSQSNGVANHYINIWHTVTMSYYVYITAFLEFYGSWYIPGSSSWIDQSTSCVSPARKNNSNLLKTMSKPPFQTYSILFWDTNCWWWPRWTLNRSFFENISWLTASKVCCTNQDYILVLHGLHRHVSSLPSRSIRWGNNGRCDTLGKCYMLLFKYGWWCIYRLYRCIYCSILMYFNIYRGPCVHELQSEKTWDNSRTSWEHKSQRGRAFQSARPGPGVTVAATTAHFAQLSEKQPQQSIGNTKPLEVCCRQLHLLMAKH